MPRVTDLSGLVGAVIVIVAAVVAAGRTVGLHRSRLVLLAGVTAITASVPLGGMPPAGLLRGVVGDLSLTTLVLLLRGLLRPSGGRTPLDARGTRALRLLIAVAGLALYPLALGMGAWDPYRLGYGDPWFLTALLVVALAALLLDVPVVTVCIAVGVLAWALRAYESRNLWDYLLDPLVFAWALSGLLLGGARAFVGDPRRTKAPLTNRTGSDRSPGVAGRAVAAGRTPGGGGRTPPAGASWPQWTVRTFLFR